MKRRMKVVTRGLASMGPLLLALVAAGTVDAAGGRGNNTDRGPYGLPVLKKVVGACSLTHDQEQAVLRVYDDYRHQEHVELQEKTPNSSGRQDCINAVEQLLTPDQKPKFESLLDQKGKKKT